MAEIVIVEQDRLDAENLLEQFLGDNLLAAGIDADIGRGSAMRDFAITAMSLVYAFMRKESDLTRQRQSLLLLGEDEGDEVDDAVDEILSNWFIRRKTGRKSRGVVTVYFNQATDVTVRRNDVFYKTNALPFVIDSDADRSYGEDDMVPVTDNTGVVTEYALRVPVIAVEAGANYDISAGPFVNFTKFSPYTDARFNRIESLSLMALVVTATVSLVYLRAQGGQEAEMLQELEEQSPLIDALVTMVLMASNGVVLLLAAYAAIYAGHEGSRWSSKRPRCCTSSAEQTAVTRRDMGEQAAPTSPTLAQRSTRVDMLRSKVGNTTGIPTASRSMDFPVEVGAAASPKLNT